MLPTREQCQQIVKNSEAFYCNEKIIQGYKVEMYNYRMASYKDFKDNDAFELRGLSFIYNPTTNAWERNIALTKFFNINENEDWLESCFKGSRLLNIQDKKDGSMIVPIKLPNGYIALRTKMSFESEQAQMSQKLYDNNKELQRFVKDCFNIGIQPIFELISPMNRIVIDYNDTKLVLLQLRDINGDYIKDIKEFSKDYNIDYTEYIESSFIEILENKETLEDIEGWILRFEDKGTKFAKVKTKWYFERHHLISESSRENVIIPMILDESIDDLLSELDDSELKDFVQDIAQKISKNFNHLVQEAIDLREVFIKDFGSDRKSFAIKHNKEKMFGIVMKTINSLDIEKDIESRVKDFILKSTSSLNDAREYLLNLN